MLVLFLQALTALHFFGLIGIVTMMQMDRFDDIRRNLAIALLVTFGSGTGLVVLLEQIQPFIWDNTASAGPIKKSRPQGQGVMEEDDEEAGGPGGQGDANGKKSGPGEGEPGGRPIRAKGTLLDCDKNCPEMVTIPGGKFLMGALPDEQGAQPSEMPQIPDVTIASFSIGRFEVTREQFFAFAKATNHSLRSSCERADGNAGAVSASKPGFDVSGLHPMVCVTWSDALKYAGWLSKITGHTYRLPTASEWEYAARYGNPYPYQNGTRSITGQDGRFGLANAKAGTTAIGSFSANVRGVFDLHGNAAEWVEDCHTASLKGSPTNGKPVFVVSAQGCERVVKGGGWHSGADEVRFAARIGYPTSTASNGIGFRVARDLD